MHTTTGPATLNAIWTANQYQCYPGQYLSASDADYHQCPANSFCDGNGTYTYTDGVDGCLNSCSTVDEIGEGYAAGSFPNSDAGATNARWCYNPETTTCTEKNLYYYGHGTPNYATSGNVNCKRYSSTNRNSGLDCTLTDVSACTITSLTCDAGYHESGTNGVLANYVNENISWDYRFTIYKSKAGEANGGSDHDGTGGTSGLNPGEWKNIWYDGTWVKGTTSCNTTSNRFAVYYSYALQFGNGQITAEQFAAAVQPLFTTQEEFAYATGLLQQYVAGTIDQNTALVLIYEKLGGAEGSHDFSTDSTGAYCWCKMTQYSIQGGTTQNASSATWTPGRFYADATECSQMCADVCGQAVKSNAFHRNAIFGSLGANMKCEPNTINLNWNPDNGDANSQSQCIYDGGITLPDEPSKSGYTFGGWSVHQGN